MSDLIIDCFAGGGGASVGIEMALGRPVDIAINHDPLAIRMHAMNHPETYHYTEDIMKVSIRDRIKPQDKVRFMWASPDCTQHSRAKGGKPVERGLRILPYGVRRLCVQILHITGSLPEVIIMENVAEIQDWGPLDENNKPIKERKGEDYKKFINSMKSLGYDFDCREIVAADYGVPTTRKRWYAIFRCDGRTIVWPKPTHNKNGSNGLKPWVPIHTILNFTDLGKSIFGRKKPLAENTMNRIAQGLWKFVFNNPEPFIVQVNHGGNHFRGQNIHKPIPTITQKHGFGIVTPIMESCKSNHGIIMSYITKFYKTGTGQSMLEPIHTITTSPGHFGQVSLFAVKKEELLKAGATDEVLQSCTYASQFIIEYYGNSTGQMVTDPIHTIVTKDRFALITVLGNEYVILDIYLRMLTAEELKLGQGFPKDYIIDRYKNWVQVPVHEKVKRIGNSVCPGVAKVLTEANVPYLRIGERMPNLCIDDEKEQISFVI